VKRGPKAFPDPRPLPLRGSTRREVAVARFALDHVRVPRGHGVRKPFRLRPWQRELVALTWDARPRPRLAGWMLPRGQGNTSLVAVLALYELLAGEDGAQVVVVATDERQAGLCHRAATRMVELNPELDRRIQLFQDRMEVPQRGSSFQVLPAVPKRLEGLDYTLAILDEAGRIDRDVFEVVTLATGKQRASVALAIGTPGPELDQTVLGGLRTYVAEHPDDPLTVWREWSAAGFEHHPVDCRHCWELANPAGGDFLAWDGLEACLPPKMRESSFRRARLCQFVDQHEEAWLPLGAWAACADATRSIPDQAEVVLAFDGSFSRDCTVLVAATIEPQPHVELVELWEAPEGRRDWRVPVVAVEDAIRAACSRWRVLEVAADPYRWQRSLEVLDGDGIPVHEFFQTAARMGPATARFYQLVVDQELTHDGDSRLARHVGNAILREDSRGARLSKETKDSPRRIDAAVAAVMAIHRAAELAGPARPDIYI
jgi:phage terminase large subunit-like protein